MLIINAEETRKLLPMGTCIDVMADAMMASSTGTVMIPPRTLLSLQDDSGFLAVMPGTSRKLQTYGAKVVSYHAANAASGRPPIQGFVTLFDHQTGVPLALIDGTVITNVRTAAASGLATRCLANPEAQTCGIFGSGALVEFHIAAMCEVRPMTECIIWARDFAKAEGLAARCSRSGPVLCRATSDPLEAAACDVICTMTASPVPILKGDWVNPGAHVNLVGAHNLSSREADSALIAKSRLYADLLESTRNEGGDFMIPIEEGIITEDHMMGEIGQVLTGDISGRQHPEDITVYNSLGITSQDLYAAHYVLQQARLQGLGTHVEF